MFFWKLSKIKISEGIFIKCFKYCLFNNDLIRECVNIVLISLTEIIYRFRYKYSCLFEAILVEFI